MTHAVASSIARASRIIRFVDEAGEEFELQCIIKDGSDESSERVLLELVFEKSPRSDKITSGIIADILRRLAKIREFEVEEELAPTKTGFTVSVVRPRTSPSCELSPAERLANGFEAFARVAVESQNYAIIEKREAAAA